MVQKEGDGRRSGPVVRDGRLSDPEGQEGGDARLSVAAQIRAWLCEASGYAERRQQIWKLLRRLVPTAVEHAFDAERWCLSAEEDAAVALRVGNTAIIVADRVSLAVSDVCERIQTRNLQPLVILDAPLGCCPRRGANPETNSDFEVLDLEQFAATVLLKRAWLMPERAQETLADIIAGCGLRTTRPTA